MSSRLEGKTMRTMSRLVLFCFLSLQVICTFPSPALADAAKDLKQIEYKYYFRGNYEEAIEAFRAFLEREDLTEAQIVEAREYLAASLILSGATEQGKLEFRKLLKMNNEYQGPAPSVFKSVIVATYDEARSEFASMVIRTVPEKAVAGVATNSQTPANNVTTEGKPLYKKWWFYATMGVVFIALAGAAGGGSSDDGGGTPDTGRVTIEIQTQ